ASTLNGVSGAVHPAISKAENAKGRRTFIDSLSKFDLMRGMFKLSLFYPRSLFSLWGVLRRVFYLSWALSVCAHRHPAGIVSRPRLPGSACSTTKRAA